MAIRIPRPFRRPSSPGKAPSDEVAEGGGAVVNDCRWQSEPRRTEPAGEKAVERSETEGEKSNVYDA